MNSCAKRDFTAETKNRHHHSRPEIHPVLTPPMFLINTHLLWCSQSTDKANMRWTEAVIWFSFRYKEQFPDAGCDICLSEVCPSIHRCKTSTWIHNEELEQPCPFFNFHPIFSISPSFPVCIQAIFFSPSRQTTPHLVLSLPPTHCVSLELHFFPPGS